MTMFNQLVKPSGNMRKIKEQENPEDAILDGAATVFAEHGFAGARVEAIARTAGLNKAMLYYRVGDKACLYELVIMRQFGRVAQAVETGASIQGGPAEKIGSILAALAGLFREDPRLPRIMAWELASGGRSLPDAVVSGWARILTVVGPIASQAGLDPLLTHLSLIGPMVLTCLTEPIRKRLGSGMPGIIGRAAGIDVGDMADFLGELYRKAGQANA